MSWYGLLKTLHILAAIVWIGGGAALTVVLMRLAGTGDRSALRPFVPQVARYMQSIGGPASGLILLSGIAMVFAGKLSFKAAWISLGFAGIILIGAFGGIVMSKRMAALEQAVATGDDAALARATAGVRQGSTILLTLMALTVVIMVLKPTF